MSSLPSEARFRLPTTFSVRPELKADNGPGRGLIVGQNSPGSSPEAVYLGKSAESPHKDVWLDVRGAHVLYVMGKRRSGKSYSLGSIAEGLTSQTWVKQGKFEQAVLILDTMNVFLSMPYDVMASFSDGSNDVQELKKWNIEAENPPITLFAPPKTNMPDELPHTSITMRASDLSTEEWCGLFQIDPFTDSMGHLIASLHEKVTTTGYKYSSGRSISPQKTYGVDELLRALDSTDGEIQNFPDSTREALRRRLTTVERSGIFSNEGLDVRSLLQPGKISVLLLRDLDQEMRSVMVSLIVKHIMRLRAISEPYERMIPIHSARAERYASSDPAKAQQEKELVQRYRSQAQEGIPRCWLIIDEAHNYAPSNQSPPSRKPLKKYVDEGRNLGLSIVVATQQPSGLDPSLQRNADLLLVHALSHQGDIDAAANMLNASIPDETVIERTKKFSGKNSFTSLVRNLPIGYALVSSDRANRLFPVKVRPRSTIHGGTEY